jgi:hypothetical protein
MLINVILISVLEPRDQEPLLFFIYSLALSPQWKKSSIIILNLLLMALQKCMVSSSLARMCYLNTGPKQCAVGYHVCHPKTYSIQECDLITISFIPSTGATIGRWFSSCKKYSRLSCKPRKEEKNSERSALYV